MSSDQPKGQPDKKTEAKIENKVEVAKPTVPAVEPTKEKKVASAPPKPAEVSKPEAKAPAAPLKPTETPKSQAKTPTAPAKPAEAPQEAPAVTAPKILPLKKMALIIDDEPANRDFLERLIQQAKFETTSAASGAEAKQIANALKVSPMLIAIDSELPDIKGIELLKIFRSQFPQSKILMATMLDDRAVIQEAFENGCDAFLVKPHGFMELFKRLQMLEADPTVLNQLVFESHGVRKRK